MTPIPSPMRYSIAHPTDPAAEDYQIDLVLGGWTITKRFEGGFRRVVGFSKTLEGAKRYIARAIGRKSCGAIHALSYRWLDPTMPHRFYSLQRDSHGWRIWREDPDGREFEVGHKRTLVRAISAVDLMASPPTSN